MGRNFDQDKEFFEAASTAAYYLTEVCDDIEEKTISSDRIYTGKLISLKVDTVEMKIKGIKKGK